MKKTMKIGIVGYGAIGKALVETLRQQKIEGATLVGVFDVDPRKLEQLKTQKITAKESLQELTKAADLVIEAAGMASVKAIAMEVLAQQKQLIVMSVGALLLQPELIRRFHEKKCRLYFPSGAVAGLDALKAVVRGGPVKKVLLTTTKPPQGLAGAPFFDKHPIDLNRIKKATTIFSGTARQAVGFFPANINVAAAISLTGIGPSRTRVEIVADPKAKRNKHVLSIESKVGKIECVTENVPSPHNHKTSYLATMSAVALLKSIVADERFGT